MRDLVNAGALDLIIATVDAGAPAKRHAPGGSTTWPRRPRKRASTLEELPITPAQVADVVKLVEAQAVNNKVARQVVDYVLAGEGEPEQIDEAKGLAMVRDD